MATRTMTIDHHGVTYQAEVARITSTQLGVEDHGFFTFVLHCQGRGGGWGQGAGQVALDDPPNKELGEEHRHGSGAGMDLLRQVIATVGVSYWEDLAGCDVIVLREEPGDFIRGIAHLHDDDRVLIFKEFLEQAAEREKKLAALEQVG